MNIDKVVKTVEVPRIEYVKTNTYSLNNLSAAELFVIACALDEYRGINMPHTAAAAKRGYNKMRYNNTYTDREHSVDSDLDLAFL